MKEDVRLVMLNTISSSTSTDHVTDVRADRFISSTEMSCSEAAIELKLYGM